jgi:L-ascorbate metabolism protein UlaG (beta-lactamase superfamily)
MFEYNGTKITWLGHDGFKIEEEGESLIVDPFKLTHDTSADNLIISHEHFDHCNAEDLRRVLKPSTNVVAIPACKEELEKVGAKNVKYVKPGDVVHMGGFEVKAVPAYNTNKYASPGKHFHPKQDGKVGYLIKTKKGTRIYHTGDSDHIPEMKDLRPDIALLPVSGTYVMTSDEALEALNDIKPKLAIPMHYGTIVGEISDAEKLKSGSKIRVEILERE